MTRLDWSRARTHNRRRKSSPVPRVRGISNDQARELARLQRQLHQPYSGQGMSAIAAAALIRELRSQVAKRPSDGPVEPHS